MTQEKLSNEEVIKLIELKKEHERAQLEQKELDNQKLRQLNSYLLRDFSYANLTSEQIQQQYIEKQKPGWQQQKSEWQQRGAPISVQSKHHSDELINAYIAQYKDQPWYKEPKVNSEGKVELTFPADGQKTATEFLKNQAKAGESLVLIDEKTNTVIAYSDGKSGKLHHPDGTPYKDNERIPAPGVPGAVSKAEFEKEHPDLFRPEPSTVSSPRM